MPSYGSVFKSRKRSGGRGRSSSSNKLNEGRTGNPTMKLKAKNKGNLPNKASGQTTTLS